MISVSIRRRHHWLQIPEPYPIQIAKYDDNNSTIFFVYATAAANRTTTHTHNWYTTLIPILFTFRPISFARHSQRLRRRTMLVTPTIRRRRSSHRSECRPTSRRTMASTPTGWRRPTISFRCPAATYSYGTTLRMGCQLCGSLSIPNPSTGHRTASRCVWGWLPCRCGVRCRCCRRRRFCRRCRRNAMRHCSK